MTKFYDIIIIGGGASGLVSAISAKYENSALQVAVLEKLPRVGKKIIATGNGRCNISNSGIDISRYHGENVKFVISAFAQFGLNKTIDFMSSIGIMTKEEEDGKIYPCGGQASAVLDLLRLRLNKLKIDEITEFEVVKLNKKGETFELQSKSGEKFIAKKVIVCVGGMAGPQFGTDGSAYTLLEKLGHSKTKIYPALTRLKTNDVWHKALQGMKFDGSATLVSGGKKIRTEDGEILFTDYGLSGPPILQLSGDAIRFEKSVISLDLMPDKTEDEIKCIIKERKDTNPDMPLEFFFAGMFNKQIGKTLVKAGKLGKLDRLCGGLTDKEIEKISHIIKAWDFEVAGHTGWRDAQVTAGGIKTSEFFAASMESRLIQGLYAAGEVLDIYGDCGGFNLQWAWSSGIMAGKNAAKQLSGR